MTLEEAIAEARNGNHLIAVMTSHEDRIDITQTSTPGINLAIGCGALVKTVLGRLDPVAERKFLEEFVKELRS